MNVNKDHQPIRQSSDIQQIQELARQPLSKKFLEWEQLSNELVHTTSHGDYQTAARILKLSNPETATPEQINEERRRRSTEIRNQETGMLDPEIEVNGQKFDQNGILDQKATSLAATRYPDLTLNLESRGWSCGYDNVIAELEFQDMLPKLNKIGWSESEILEESKANGTGLFSTLEEIGREEIAKEFGFTEPHIHDLGWELVVRRMVKLPLGSSVVELVDRVRELKPLFDQLEPRDEHKRLLGYGKIEAHDRSTR